MRLARAALCGHPLAALLAGSWLATPVPLASAAAPLAAAPSAAVPSAAAPSAAAPRPQPQRPIVIDAAFSHVDYKTNTVVFRNVVVSQGGTRVTAERARAAGVGFTDSRWTFEGQVLIALQPQGTLRSDQAVVQFRDDGIAGGTATGKPAIFEFQPTDARATVRGRADRIVYDAQSDSVQLSGDARVSDGPNVEVSGPLLVYNIRDEQLQGASPGERRRLHITVAPQSSPHEGSATRSGDGRRKP